MNEIERRKKLELLVEYKKRLESLKNDAQNKLGFIGLFTGLYAVSHLFKSYEDLVKSPSLVILISLISLLTADRVNSTTLENEILKLYSETDATEEEVLKIGEEKETAEALKLIKENH